MVSAGKVVDYKARVGTWPDDAQFMRVGGDVLSCGAVKDVVEFYLQIKPVALPFGSTLQDVSNMTVKAEKKIAVRIARKYLCTALVAQLALSNGCSAANAVCARTNAVANIIASFKGKQLDVVHRMLADPNSYFAKSAENISLADDYANNVLKPQIIVTEDQISTAIVERAEAIVKVKERNARARTNLGKLAIRIREGKLDFAKAAAACSDCGSADEGGDMGEFDRDCALLPPLKDAIFSLPTNVISDVVETDCSYHIVRVNVRNMPDPDDGKGPESVEFSHIMVEKQKVPEALDRESARQFLIDYELAERVEAAQKSALTNVVVECIFPRVDIGKNKKKPFNSNGFKPKGGKRNAD